MEKYDNLGMVGEGSYGMVMKCKHKETGQIVAIKKFLESEDDKMVKKIAMREVRMLRKLRHENLVNLIEVFRRRKRLYLVFEFVDHTVLDDLEKYPNGLSEMTVRKVLWQVLRGVEFCHSHNIIHRDIKPENILNSRNGVIKICDFGFARTLATPGEIYTDYVATRWYRAPELLVGDAKYGRPVDVWAIGCLIGEMLTGDPIFPGKSDIDQMYRVMKHLGNLCPRHKEIFHRNPLFAGMRLPEVREVEPLEKRFPRFSLEVLDLMKQCLRLDPNDRPSSSMLLRHEFFRKDHFEDKVIPELRAKIQKDNQNSLLFRKSLADKQDHESKRKKTEENAVENTTASQSKSKVSPKTTSSNKDTPVKGNKSEESNPTTPRKEPLAQIKPQDNENTEKSPKKKETEKNSKLPATINQTNAVVKQKQKQSPQKPTTILKNADKRDNKIETKASAEKPPTQNKTSNVPSKLPVPKELKKDDSTFNSAEKSKSTPKIGESKSVIIKSKESPKEKKAKEAFQSDSQQPSKVESREKIVQKQSINKTSSDTLVTKESRHQKSFKPEKQTSVSNPPSSMDKRHDDEDRNRKSDLSKIDQKSFKTKLKSDDAKTSTYHIPPIQSHGNPTTSKVATDHLEKTITENLRQYNQGFKGSDKAKKVMKTNSESYSPQASFEKNMYGNSPSNLEKMMMSMSGTTSIQHPAIRKTTHTQGPSITPGLSSYVPGQLQFSQHVKMNNDEGKGSNLPIWTQQNDRSFQEKQRMQNANHRQNEKYHNRHKDHHQKVHQLGSNLDKLSNAHRDMKDKADQQKRTKLPDLPSKSIGTTSKESNHFPGIVPAPNEAQKRKTKTKPMLMSMQAMDTNHRRQQGKTSPEKMATTFADANFPSVGHHRN